jgi:hypothetical protein
VATILDTISAGARGAWEWLAGTTRRLARDAMTAATGNNSKPVWPPESEQPRLRAYADMEALYSGQQASFYKRQGYKQENEQRPYVCCNLLSLLTNLIASRLYGEGYNITVPAEAAGTQEYIEELDRANDLQQQVLRAAIESSPRGDAAWRIAYEGGDRQRVVVRSLHPGKVFPEWDALDAERLIAANVDQILRIDAKHCYLWRERHELRGEQSWVINKLFRVEEAQGVFHFDETEDEVPLETLDATATLAPETATGIDALLVVFVRGRSDYSEDLLSLQGEYNQRLTQVADLLDKYLPPILTGPLPAENALDYTGTVQMGQMRYIASDAGQETVGVTMQEWVAAGFGATDTHLDRIKADFAATSGVDFTALFPDNASGAQSGTALRRQQMKTQATVALRRVDEAPMLRVLYSTCCKLAAAWPLKWRAAASDESQGGEPTAASRVAALQPEDFVVAFADGLPPDPQEELDIQERRLLAGIQSKADAIKLLDNVSDDDAQRKVEEIRAENAASQPVTTPGLLGRMNSPGFASVFAPAAQQPPEQGA